MEIDKMADAVRRLDQQMRVVAAERRLGDQVQEVRKDLSKPISRTLVLWLPTLGAPVLVSLVLIRFFPTTGKIVIIIAAALLLIAVFRPITQLRRVTGNVGAQIVRVHTGGVLWGIQKPSGKQVMRAYPWPEVENMSYAKITRRINAMQVIEHNLRLNQTGTALPLVLSYGLQASPEMLAVIEQIAQRYDSYLVNEALNAVNRGESFAFDRASNGGVELESNGITLGRKFIPWSQIGEVRRKKVGTPDSSATVVAIDGIDGNTMATIDYHSVKSSTALIIAANTLATTARQH